MAAISMSTSLCNPLVKENEKSFNREMYYELAAQEVDPQVRCPCPKSIIVQNRTWGSTSYAMCLTIPPPLPSSFDSSSVLSPRWSRRRIVWMERPVPPCERVN